MTDHERERADSWRLLQAEAVLELFRRANEREPQNVEELAQWCKEANLSTPVDPAAVFTRQQLDYLMRKRS